MGSSPHTRGAPLHDAGEVAALRIIPAYAGSTAQTALKTTIRAGSSPHTRGAHLVVAGDGVLRRIIPAYAGSTPESDAAGRVGWDHPRIRGEHRGGHVGGPGGGGSSPHTRGAHCCRWQSATALRIIPAYAGSTDAGVEMLGGAQDHPRIRGEHGVFSGRARRRAGSSPHTRGARGRARVYPISSRIIPAYAGSTGDDPPQKWAGGDHPRIRGEHDTPLTNVTPFTGSSPHTRGAPVIVAAPGGFIGIIPAYAGSTRPSPATTGAGPDHPRIRGEHRVRP